ncbi:MAG: hypothetical protein QW327_00990 [Candidatus Odinarchaeota archaeon]
MSIRIIAEKLIKLYEKFKDQGKQDFMLKSLGGITVRVFASDTGECFNIVIGDGVHIEDCSQKKPNITIEGCSGVLKEVLESKSQAFYDKAQTEGRIKLRTCNIRGRLFYSRFKKWLNFNIM